MPGRMQFDFTFKAPRGEPRRRPDDASPFRILVLGDFSARGLRAESDSGSLASRTIHTVDLDNFEHVLARLAPRVTLPASAPGAPNTVIELRSLDDFHPDRLYRSLPLFGSLRETRAKLLDPTTFASAAAQLRIDPAAPAAPPPSVSTPQPKAENDADTLERLLGYAPATPAAPSVTHARPDAIAALIRNIVGPYIVPDAPAFQAQYVAAVDAACAEQLRAILHDEGFQASESIWRGLHRLVSSLELGEVLALDVLDVTRAELMQDALMHAGAVERSALYQRLVDAPQRGIGAARWSLIAGLFEFGASEDDAQACAVLAAIGASAGAPFIGSGAASLAGCDSWVAAPDPRQWQAPDAARAPGWYALRTSALASWVALAAPRVLLRLPYGPTSDPIEAFDFDELAARDVHAYLLWGNPALACTQLIAQAFLDAGWDMQPGDHLDIGELPAHIVEHTGEKQMHACAEVYLSERAGEAMLECGLIPLMSFRNRNAIRALRISSIAQPPRPLAGPWAAQ